MIVLYCIAILVFIVLVVVCAVSAYFFKFAIVGRHATIEQTLKKSENNPAYSPYYDRITSGVAWIKSYSHNRVSIVSHDGLKLYASVFEPEIKSSNCMLLFHGWSSHPLFDFSCIVKEYVNMGYNVVLVEQRGHGESEGKYSCFGVKERYDVISWAKFIIERYGDDVKIALDGISMGSSTVMMAAGLEELPQNIVGIIADCGFTSAYDQFVHIMKKWYNMPPFPFIYSVDIIAKLVAGFGFKQVSTDIELKKSSIPLLILHGGDDDFVPVKFSRRNFEASAAKDKKLIVVEGAGHGTSYIVDEDNCKKELSEFLTRVFSQK